jgi:uncharacterized protein (TIGR03118 family)
MKSQLSQSKDPQTRSSRPKLLGLAALFALVCTSVSVASDPPKADNYAISYLVSDIPDVSPLQDPNLINAWGISFSPTSPFWVSANGTGLALLYSVTNDASGNVQVAKVGLEVTIPGEGTPTGQVFNGDTNNFNGDLFIFASEDGTISGWRPALGTAAETLTQRDSAVYKGITLATSGNAAMLLAANFREGTVDVYDGSMNLVGQFSDGNAPAGYAPFNVQLIAGQIFVTFAKQDAAKHDDVAGDGHGLIDMFDLSSGTFSRFATGSDAGGKLKEINSPWGMALAPSSFGKHADQLLVGNFGSGTIMTFEASGKFRKLLEGTSKKSPIVINGLWGLTFGNGARAGDTDTLFFSAGPLNESHGLFGTIEPVGKVKKNSGGKKH